MLPLARPLKLREAETMPPDLTPALPAHGDPSGLGESPWEEAGQAARQKASPSCRGKHLLRLLLVQIPGPRPRLPRAKAGKGRSLLPVWNWTSVVSLY